MPPPQAGKGAAGAGAGAGSAAAAGGAAAATATAMVEAEEAAVVQRHSAVGTWRPAAANEACRKGTVQLVKSIEEKSGRAGEKPC